MKKKIVTLQVMSIVHGKSELNICQHIKSNLRIKHEIYSRDNGKISIQVTSVLDVLNGLYFRDFAHFTKEFDDIERKGKKLENFSLFIILDVDDCTEIQKEMFINKEMFRGHWLYDYIVPIYCDPKLEKVMEEAGIPIVKKKDYMTIFPLNHSDLDLPKAKELFEKLKKCKCSNMADYLEYCISIAESNVIENPKRNK